MEMLTAKLQQIWAGKPSDTLVAFALCEDAATSGRIEHFCQRVVRELAPGRLIKRAWLCNELRSPRLKAIAVSEAAAADVVALAIHHADELAPEIVSWLSLVLQGDRRPSLVFALFDGTHSGDSSSLRATLLELTQSVEVELVTVWEEMPEDELA
jgi:hypothetical protein